MKRIIVFLLLCCLLLAGCASFQDDGSSTLFDDHKPAEDAVTEDIVTEEAFEPEAEAETKTISPLPDTTMDHLTDAILSVSLEEGDAYVDDHGVMQMDLKIYSYDRYDMVDIADLKVGDTLLRQSGEVEVTSVERNEAGTLHINGGLEAEGFDLVTEEDGVFCERGFSDVKNWFEVGEVTIRVSADFTGTDSADPEQGEVMIYPGDFLTGAVTNYHFTPYNTTVRVENGQIVELHRIYTP